MSWGRAVSPHVPFSVRPRFGRGVWFVLDSRPSLKNFKIQERERHLSRALVTYGVFAHPAKENDQGIKFWFSK